MTDEFLNKYAAEKHIPAEFYAELRALDESSKNKLVEILEIIAPSSNALQGIYKLANEIARREGLTFSGLFNKLEIESIFALDKISRKEKTALSKAFRRVALSREIPNHKRRSRISE